MSYVINANQTVNSCAIESEKSFEYQIEKKKNNEVLILIRMRLLCFFIAIKLGKRKTKFIFNVQNKFLRSKK